MHLNKSWYSHCLPLPPLKPMDQLRFGVKQMLEVQTHPMALAIPIFIQIHMPLLLLKLMDQFE
jgi:hypothetical protein